MWSVDAHGTVTFVQPSGVESQWTIDQWPAGLRPLFQAEFERVKEQARRLRALSLPSDAGAARRAFDDKPWVEWHVRSDGRVSVTKRGKKRKFDTPAPAIAFLEEELPFLNARELLSRPLLRLSRRVPQNVPSAVYLEPGGAAEKKAAAHWRPAVQKKSEASH